MDSLEFIAHRLVIEYDRIMTAAEFSTYADTTEYNNAAYRLSIDVRAVRLE